MFDVPPQALLDEPHQDRKQQQEAQHAEARCLLVVEVGLGEPAVWESHGWYWMLYTARDRKEWRRIGLARSQDGVRWTRVSKKPVFVGEADWNRQVVCDPTVLPAEDGSVHVWFGGGNLIILLFSMIE